MAWKRFYGGTTTGSDELWLFEDVDFAAIAESFGCLGMTVTEPSAIGGALERAFAAERPVVIDVKTAVDGIAPRGVGRRADVKKVSLCEENHIA